MYFCRLTYQKCNSQKKIFISNVYFNIVFHFKAFNEQNDYIYKGWNTRKQLFKKKKGKAAIFMFINIYVYDIILQPTFQKLHHAVYVTLCISVYKGNRQGHKFSKSGDWL